MALSRNQAVGSTAATLQKAKLRRQQGGMAPAEPGKPAAKANPDAGPSGMMPRGVRAPPNLPTGMQAGGMSPGAQGGGPQPQGPPGGNQDLMRLLPPKMQAAMAQNGRDPREAIATRMQNDPIFKQKMIAMQQQGGLPGVPSSGPIMSSPMQPSPVGPRIDAGGDQVQASGGPPSLGGGPDAAVSGIPGQGIGGPPPPPGADIGGPMPPGGMQGGFQGAQGGFGGMNQQQLRQMLPPAMQQGFPGGFAGNPQGLNLQSLQLAQQGGGPASGGQPQLSSVNPYRGM